MGLCHGERADDLETILDLLDVAGNAVARRTPIATEAAMKGMPHGCWSWRVRPPARVMWS